MPRPHAPAAQPAAASATLALPDGATHPAIPSLAAVPTVPAGLASFAATAPTAAGRLLQPVWPARRPLPRLLRRRFCLLPLGIRSRSARVRLRQPGVPGHALLHGGDPVDASAPATVASFAARSANTTSYATAAALARAPSGATSAPAAAASRTARAQRATFTRDAAVAAIATSLVPWPVDSPRQH